MARHPCDFGSMTSDTSLAFAHPEERAAATAFGLRDRISLRDHIVTADIGAFQQERGRPQRLRFDIVVEVRQAGDAQDDVDRILSYDRLTEAVAAELAGDRLNLLETLAERLAERILAEPQAMRAFVRIQKLDIGPYALGVEIARSRAEVPVRRHNDALHPLVVFLDNAALAAADLPARLTAWEAAGNPVVLAVGLPDLPRPVTGHAPTQRRIDLLAIGQNAWALAARDPRCVVVETRTEIDHAMRHGRTVVWAPSKLVLDAADAPATRAPQALALWLAEQLSAAGLMVYGDVAVPAGSRVPVLRA
jgi:dihydroneopterin aldolase